MLQESHDACMLNFLQVRVLGASHHSYMSQRHCIGIDIVKVLNKAVQRQSLQYQKQHSILQSNLEQPNKKSVLTGVCRLMVYSTGSHWQNLQHPDSWGNNTLVMNHADDQRHELPSDDL